MDADIGDDTLQIARAHLFSAQILNLEARPDEAGPHLDHAERLLHFGDDAIDRGLLRAEQAKREAKLGAGAVAGARALALAREAVALLDADVRHASNAWHAMGAAHTALGDLDAANAAYEWAVTSLADREQWREAIYVAREWAGALRNAGRDDRAYAVLEQATEFSQRVGAARIAVA